MLREVTQRRPWGQAGCCVGPGWLRRAQLGTTRVGEGLAVILSPWAEAVAERVGAARCSDTVMLHGKEVAGAGGPAGLKLGTRGRRTVGRADGSAPQGQGTLVAGNMESLGPALSCRV